MSSSILAAIHLGQDKNTIFENVENCVQRHSKMNKRTFRRNSECERPGLFITVMDEIDIGRRSRDQMGEGKSLCLR